MNSVRQLRQQRKHRVRNQLKAHSTRPRLVVHRTNQHIYAQLIDSQGQVIVAASDAGNAHDESLTKTDRAKQVGKAIAQAAKTQKITNVTFDRGQYKYHGRVKAVAQGARQAGLEF